MNIRRAKGATCRPDGVGTPSSSMPFQQQQQHDAATISRHHLLWEADVVFPVDTLPRDESGHRVIEFQFAVVVQDDQEVYSHRHHQSAKHVLKVYENGESGPIDVYVSCVWVDSSHPGQVLRAGAFTRVVMPHVADERQWCRPSSPALHTTNKNDEVTVQLHVMDLELRDGDAVCVTGGTAILGNWQLKQVVWMTPSAAGTRGCWHANVRIPIGAFPVTYKYAIGKPDNDLILEPGESRLLVLPPPMNNICIAAYDGFVRRQDRWRGAGVAVPVFSLRSKDSIGCGEFSDLVPLGKWCQECGFSLLQLLPVCDTQVTKTWRDSYPYSSLCVFALHPMYLNVCDMLDSCRAYRLDDKGLYGMLKELVVSKREHSQQHCVDVDYEETVAFKISLARRIFDEYGIYEMKKNDAYMEFQAANAHWLKPYAVFCFLRDFFKTAEHWKWGVYSKPTPEMLEHLASPDKEWYYTIQFHCYLQFKLHQQLLQASKRLREMGIAVKGDLPIGVDKCSVDTWLHADLFRMNTSTGAPPDYFDPKGQNWGFPTYNWEAMSKDGYAWWRKRLAHMKQYFQAYRIDHILGFFRIWELPCDTKTGILGRFRPSSGYTRAELESHGLWDIDRLADPFVTSSLLHELLDDPELEAEVTERFFEPCPGNRLRFKQRYASEMAVSALRCRPGVPDSTAVDTERVHQVLIMLSQNVCIIKDGDLPHGNYFPRFNLMETKSFEYLEDLHWKAFLRNMHDDSFYGTRSDALWRSQAYKTLPMMQNATDMLVCGEDLGLIPSCVHPIMEELGIIGLRIQRMPSEQGIEFGMPSAYGYMTVASPSSHDTSNFRAWFEEDEARRARYCRTILGLEDVAPDVCTPDIVRFVVRQHLACPSILAIFSIQDIIGMSHTLPQRDANEETINVPSNPEHYWRYRMHITLEQLDQDDELKQTLKNLITSSGRMNSFS